MCFLIPLSRFWVLRLSIRSGENNKGAGESDQLINRQKLSMDLEVMFFFLFISEVSAIHKNSENNFALQKSFLYGYKKKEHILLISIFLKVMIEIYISQLPSTRGTNKLCFLFCSFSKFLLAKRFLTTCIYKKLLSDY